MEKVSFFISRNALPSRPNCSFYKLCIFLLHYFPLHCPAIEFAKYIFSTASLKDKQGQAIFFLYFSSSFYFCKSFFRAWLGQIVKVAIGNERNWTKHFKPFPIRALALEFPKCENHSIGFYSRCSKNKSPNVEQSTENHLEFSLFVNQQISHKPSLLFQDFEDLLWLIGLFSIKTEQRYVKTPSMTSFFIHRNFSCKLINGKKAAYLWVLLL